MDNYIVPEIDALRFTCPHCGTLASVMWSSTGIGCEMGRFYFYNSMQVDVSVKISTCSACGEFHLWFGEKMLIPTASNVPMPNNDMPEKVKEVYLEAREVFPYSARASVALLRLAIQKLCIELGGEGKNINDDIGSLVKQGLPIKIQQALDAIRVIGNNAVHPGTIDLDDNKEMAALLFQFINVIVSDMITQPKSIESLYSQLPSGALDAIKKRDGK